VTKNSDASTSCSGEISKVSEMWLAGGLLLGLAAIFLLLPGLFLRRGQVHDLTTSNREWFEQRSAELSLEPIADDELLQDARLRVLQDADTSVAPTSTPTATTDEGGSAGRVLLLVPLALLAFVLYWQLGAAADVQLTRNLQGISDESSDEDYRQLMLQVEQRAGERPQNLHYQAMLGRFYMNEADYGRARVLYLKLVEQAPGDSSALALAAQASYLAAGRVLDENSQMLAEQALSIDPHQRTALGLLGMAAYENAQYQAAISYWQRLLVMENPDSSSAQMIQGVIARAQAALTGSTSESPHAAAASTAQPEAAVAVAGAGIQLRLELAPGSEVSASDTVFVFARNPAVASRMPIAVQKLTAAQLPLSLRLDDSNSMAGQKLSELAQVTVVARVSPSGRPDAQSASYQAELGPLQPAADGPEHALVLRAVDQPGE
jgi:cytochrome c-type biogenesis protein CcmH